MKNVTLQSIFQMAYGAFETSHRLPYYVRAAARVIMACRTAVLGGHIQACPDGHYHRQWYNSCKHRVCPLCAWIQIERWLLKRKSRLLACDHYRAIFTVPHQLNELWLLNVKGITNILFRDVRDTLFELLDDDKHLGARPGIIASLHTWSQTLLLHPHIYPVEFPEGNPIQWGTLSDNGRWIRVRGSVAIGEQWISSALPGGDE